MSLLIKKILEKVKNIDTKIKTGQEIATNEYIDGKRVYRKRIDCGAGPGAGEAKEVDTGLSNVTYTKIEGIVQGSVSAFPINNSRPIQGTDKNAIGVYVNYSTKKINIETVIDRSNYTVFVELYYTKN